MVGLRFRAIVGRSVSQGWSFLSVSCFCSTLGVRTHCAVTLNRHYRFRDNSSVGKASVLEECIGLSWSGCGSSTSKPPSQKSMFFVCRSPQNTKVASCDGPTFTRCFLARFVHFPTRSCTPLTDNRGSFLLFFARERTPAASSFSSCGTEIYPRMKRVPSIGASPPCRILSANIPNPKARAAEI